MASKRPVARNESDKRRKAKTVLRLSERAEAEVAKLLKRAQDGTITRMELETGLQEVDERLNQILPFIRYLL